MAGDDKSKRNSHTFFTFREINSSGSVEDGEGAQVAADELGFEWNKQTTSCSWISGEKFRESSGG